MENPIMRKTEYDVPHDSLEVYKNAEEYWLKKLAGDISEVSLPVDSGRTLDYENCKFEVVLDKKLSCSLLGDNQAYIELYIVLLTVYKILLFKYTGQDDVIVVSPIYDGELGKGDNKYNNEYIIFRDSISTKMTYNKLYSNVKETTLSGYANQYYNIDKIFSILQIDNELSLFRAMLILENIHGKELINGLINSTANEITMSFAVEEDQIQCIITYKSNLFKKDTIQRFFERYICILKQVLLNHTVKLMDIDIITKEETRRIMLDFNNTSMEYPEEKTIHELFEEQLKRVPDKVAVVFEDKHLTYKELNEKSNQIARKIRKIGINPNDIIGLMTGRSLEMIIGILGILKAGGAYLPLDPEYPQERIKYMLDNSNTNIILTCFSLADRVNIEGIIINLDDDSLYRESVSDLKIENTSKDLAYVIYTSGSTGEPKGVMIEHRGIGNLKVFFNKSLCISMDDRIIQFASISFDASVFEIFMSLLSGATLYIVSRNTIVNYIKFEKFLNENRITVATLPPVYLANLSPDRVITLKKLITAGSPISIELVNKWKEKLQYINAYGPTEATICTTVWKYNSESLIYNSPPIGSPIYNAQVYIVDRNNKLQPIGIPGEVCIAGDMLAKGYLNRQELSDEKFVQNPFNSNKKMYRTGDCARWLPDGNLEFLGRIDNQVKIKGFRIELGEIESQLRKYELIKDAVVVSRDFDKGNYLCAYVVSDNELKLSRLRGYLSQILPEYMIPSFFVQVKEIPLTHNGKLDIKRLPSP